MARTGDTINSAVVRNFVHKTSVFLIVLVDPRLRGDDIYYVISAQAEIHLSAQTENRSIRAEQVPRVHLIRNISNIIRKAVGNNHIRHALECFKVVHYP